MGRPPGNGVPAFRFLPNEVTEMESILQEQNNALPPREILIALAEKFSESPDRKGKTVVQMKQVWNWFQNKRYSIRAKAPKIPMKLDVTPLPRDCQAPAITMFRPVTTQPVAPISVPVAALSVPSAGKPTTYMEFEAKSARDGAWYDVGTFLSHRHLDTGDPEVLVRFSGFGPEEDEWLNVCRNVRQRSLPCETSECVAVLPGDLILCFQEGKEQALYFDAHVLDAQRRRHDVRGCRCRFLVRFDHDQSEKHLVQGRIKTYPRELKNMHRRKISQSSQQEIVPLRKVCRRPETDYRLQQPYTANDSVGRDQQKPVLDPSVASLEKVVIPAAETTSKQNVSGEAVAVPVPQALACSVQVQQSQN